MLMAVGRLIILTGCLASALLIGAIPSVLAHELSGTHGDGHDKLHHWYKTLTQPRTGFACCDGRDCRPTTARFHNGLVEVIVDGEWTIVPPGTIIDTVSPDRNSHVCAPPGPWSPKFILCVVLAPGA